MTKLRIVKAIDPYTFTPRIGLMDGSERLGHIEVSLDDTTETITTQLRSLVDEDRYGDLDDVIDGQLKPRMTINEYQDKAIETAIYGEGSKIIYPTLGLAGEAGEVADKVKKVLRDNEGEFSEEKKLEIAKELSDTCWYIAALARDLGYTLEEICIINLEKLKSRQERGVIGGSGDNR
jgi:NTP pyrophosphatase (non-canonical NTP hydrolase)